jgi:hypothetical protein
LSSRYSLVVILGPLPYEYGAGIDHLRTAR